MKRIIDLLDGILFRSCVCVCVRLNVDAQLSLPLLYVVSTELRAAEKKSSLSVMHPVDKEQVGGGLHAMRYAYSSL